MGVKKNTWTPRELASAKLAMTEKVKTQEK